MSLDLPISNLVDWANSKGVLLNGITPRRLLGRGVGLIATRKLQVCCLFLQLFNS